MCRFTEMAEWSSRPLEKVYAAVFIDAIYVQGPGKVAILGVSRGDTPVEV